VRSVLVRFVWIACLCGSNTGCGLCADTVKSEVPSPNGRYIATAFVRDCGATTGYVTMVSLRKTRTLFGYPKPTRVLSVDGQPDVALVWGSRDTLSVTYEGGVWFTKLESWRDVRIVYRVDFLNR
jgi:hypothetical protein